MLSNPYTTIFLNIIIIVYFMKMQYLTVYTLFNALQKLTSFFMYNKNKHIHFIGIGGIGMSGIAKILKQQGYTVSGCDADLSQDTITQVKNSGCAVYAPNNSSDCHDTSIDILVY